MQLEHSRQKIYINEQFLFSENVTNNGEEGKKGSLSNLKLFLNGLRFQFSDEFWEAFEMHTLYNYYVYANVEYLYRSTFLTLAFNFCYKNDNIS